MRSDYKFLGASLLSALASFVFGAFFLIGLLALFSERPLVSEQFLPGLQLATVRAVGACVTLFGMLGLLFARAVVVLIEIEKSVRAARLPAASATMPGHINKDDSATSPIDSREHP